MSVEDLLDQVICERIEMLLNARPVGPVPKEAGFEHKMEGLLEQLGKEWKEEMETFWDDWIARCADENRYLYFAGVKDGFRIYRMMLENE